MGLVIILPVLVTEIKKSPENKTSLPKHKICTLTKVRY